MTSGVRFLAWVAVSYLFIHAMTVNVRPLLRIPGGGSFYTVPKMINLGIWMGLVALALLVTLRTVDVAGSLRRLRREPVMILWIVAVLLLAVAPFMATRTPLNLAVLGFPFRYDGPYVILFSLILAAAMARFVMLDRSFIRVGVGTFLAMTGVVAVIGIIQSQGYDFWAWLGVNGLGTTPRTTLGNPAFASLIPAMGAIIVANIAGGEEVRSNPRKAALWIAFGVFLAFAAGSASSRSAVVGYWVVLAIWTTVNLLRGVRVGDWKRALYPALIAGLFVGAQAIGGNSNQYASGKFEALTDMVTGERVDNSWETRVRFWTIAMRALQEQPLVPYGSGAYSVVMWEFANPEETRELYKMFVPEEAIPTVQRQQNVLIYQDPNSGEQVGQRVNSDKVHNYLLDAWLAYGIFPTLALVAIIVAIVVRMVQAGGPVPWAVISAGTVYAFFSMAWFPAVATDPLVFALLGIGWGAAERKLRGIPDEPEDDGNVTTSNLLGRTKKLSRAEARRRKRKG